MRNGLVVPSLLIMLLAGCAGHRARKDSPALPSSDHVVVDAVPDSTASSRDETLLPQSRRYRHDTDGGPLRSPVDIASLPEPVPHSEPRSRYGNKSPYTVRGKTYRVLGSAKGYDQRGIASWYGSKFHGYLTSSFEKYDMYKFTAASKVLPLPTWVRVTNIANGKSVIVRVNDRGPFVANRIIDLSYAAAVRINIWSKGTGLVEVQAIDPAHVQELPKPKVMQGMQPHADIWLQVGAFADPANADRIVSRLHAAGLGPVQVSRLRMHGHDMRRVRLGPLKSMSAADRLRHRVTALGLPVPKVAVD